MHRDDRRKQNMRQRGDELIKSIDDYKVRIPERYHCCLDNSKGWISRGFMRDRDTLRAMPYVRSQIYDVLHCQTGTFQGECSEEELHAIFNEIVDEIIRYSEDYAELVNGIDGLL